MPIHAVALDFGGVLTTSPFESFAAYARELGLEEDALVRYFSHDPMMARLEVGEISSREFFKYVCVEAQRAHGVRIDVHRLADAASAAQRLDPAMMELIAGLSDRLRLALVTNNVASAEWRDTFPFDLFSVVLDSSDLGLRKPDPAIYHELSKRLGLAPDEIVFVDDLAINTAAAAGLGFHTVTFTGVEAFRAALTDLDISATAR